MNWPADGVGVPKTPRHGRKVAGDNTKAHSFMNKNTSNILLETGIFKNKQWSTTRHGDLVMCKFICVISRYDERDECIFITGTIRLTIVCRRAFLQQCMRRDTKLLLRSRARLWQTDVVTQWFGTALGTKRNASRQRSAPYRSMKVTFYKWHECARSRWSRDVSIHGTYVAAIHEAAQRCTMRGQNLRVLPHGAPLN